MKDKHSSFEITQGVDNKQVGVNVISVSHNRISGETIRKKYFIKAKPIK